MRDEVKAVDREQNPAPVSWDYLALTASNDRQAQAYADQLRARRDLGLLPTVRETIVVPDEEGKRIGSGGSTLFCLLEILRREHARRGFGWTPDGVREALSGLRILIVHAGGDSRRLPAYGPCGKIFVPLPAAGDSALPPALFDRLVPAFLALPPGLPGAGQIVVAAGDALILYDARGVALDRPGLIALGAYATPEEASRHGVFCMASDGTVSRYLQKPPIPVQRSAGAIDAQGRTPLDIGVMNMDGAAAAALLFAFGAECGAETGIGFSPQARARILDLGLDLYREICCALGSDASLESYVEGARASGSKWPSETLAAAFPHLRALPFAVELVPECRFLHFGSTRQLVESGLALVTEDEGATPSSVLRVNSVLEGKGLHRRRRFVGGGVPYRGASDLVGLERGRWHRRRTRNLPCRAGLAWKCCAACGAAARRLGSCAVTAFAIRSKTRSYKAGGSADARCSSGWRP